MACSVLGQIRTFNLIHSAIHTDSYSEMNDIRSDQDGIYTILIEANKLRLVENYRGAITLYLKAAELFSEDTSLIATIAHCYFALALSQQGSDQDRSAAIAWMDKAVNLRPNDAHLYTDLGLFYSLEGLDYGKASLSYRRAIEINPNNFEALSELQRCMGHLIM